ncbi:hypothetical protein ENUP19_0020G0053 [Entamoeba nuttalli]|uniref:Uncharacterized protein n=1 Tax=Entamoeba nuttalli TaxID=412467 RepID=A0ABQ0D8Z1_9EUKA
MSVADYSILSTISNMGPDITGYVGHGSRTLPINVVEYNCFIDSMYKDLFQNPSEEMPFQEYYK